MFRVSNIGLSTSLNFRIQGHQLKLVEVEGSHVMQNTYDSLDVHVGQSVTFLVTLDQPPKDYYIVVSTRFIKPVLNTTAVLHYTNSKAPVSGPIPSDPSPNPLDEFKWSLNQAKSFRYIYYVYNPRIKTDLHLSSRHNLHQVFDNYPVFVQVESNSKCSKA